MRGAVQLFVWSMVVVCVTRVQTAYVHITSANQQQWQISGVAGQSVHLCIGAQDADLEYDLDGDCRIDFYDDCEIFSPNKCLGTWLGSQSQYTTGNDPTHFTPSRFSYRCASLVCPGSPSTPSPPSTPTTWQNIKATFGSFAVLAGVGVAAASFVKRDYGTGWVCEQNTGTDSLKPLLGDCLYLLAQAKPSDPNAEYYQGNAAGTCSAQICDQDLKDCASQSRPMKHADFYDGVDVIVNHLSYTDGSYTGGACKGTGDYYGLSVDVNRDTSAQCGCVVNGGTTSIVFNNCPAHQSPKCSTGLPCQCYGPGR